jgi:Zn-finger nucleic acid-binding protein
LENATRIADVLNMTISDDDWLAAARTRAARGEWERPADVMFAELRRDVADLKATDPAGANCPYCPAHPLLVRFQRFELQTMEPLLYCRNCFGFWAKGDALGSGVADPGANHPTLEAVPAPRRCRACFGHLTPDGACTRCDQALPALDCPACARVMQRFEKDGVTLDQCAACNGTWFDMGEIVRVYNLAPAQGLAASTIDEHATDDEPPGWLIALNIAARLAFPFLPL